MSKSERDCEDQSSDEEQCVMCGSEDHDGDGWIYPTSDTEVVEITAQGVERELKDDARPLCSTECKDEFAEQEGIDA